MTKKHKLILLSILTIICGTIVFFQFLSQKQKHERLLVIGQYATVTAKHTTSWGVDYADYFFITAKGQKIEKTEKCGNSNGFNKYIGAIAIYNPKVPTEYELLFDFENYSLTWSIIFFFFMYLPVMIGVNFGIINFIVKVYPILSGKKGVI